jgi:multiple sugar transport system substrate-binding protein
MAVKPADRLLFVIALTVLGAALVFRLAAPGALETPPEPEPQGLAIRLTEESGLSAQDLEALIAGYSRESRIDITINAEDKIPDILIGGPSLAVDTRALPLVSAVDVLIYNIPLLRRAGFDRPPRTRGDFLGYARTLKTLAGEGRAGEGRTTEAGGSATTGGGAVYGLALGLSPRDPRGLRRDIYSWFHSSGLPLVKDGKPEFGGRPYTETLEFLATLNREALIAPGSFNASGAERIEDFVRGAAAMMVVSSRDLRYIREKMGSGAIGVTLIPSVDTYTGKPVLGLSTWYAAVNAESPRPSEARALLRLLQERSALLAEALALAPGAGSYSPYISVDPLLDKVWDLYEAAELVPDSAGSGSTEALDAAFRRELIRLFHPDSPSSAEEAAQAIRQSWEQ